MKKVISIAFLPIILTGCNHYYYIPPKQNVPLFKEKNEFRATAAMGSSGVEGASTSIQAAYSVTNHFAVMSSYMSAKVGDNAGSNSGNRNYYDMAIGYFKPIKNHGIFEIYAGIGSSNQTHQYENSYYFDGGSRSTYAGKADLSFIKTFIQPTFGLTFNSFDIAITTGFSRLSFNKINNQIDPDNSEYLAVDAISQNKNSLLFEPSLTIRGGGKYVKLELQFLYSQNLTHSNLNFAKENLNLGLTFAFAQRFRKKVTKSTTGH